MKRMVRRPYRARTLSGANQMVACLRKQIEERDRLINRWAAERVTLAKLAAETPQFYNPLVAMEAKQLRDRILSNTQAQVSSEAG